MITTVVGRIVDCLPIQSGISKANGKEWKAQQYTITLDDEQEDVLCFQVFGEEKIATYDLYRGKKVAVTLEIECKEWNGKWVTNLSCKQCWVIPNKPEQKKEAEKPKVTSNEFDYN